MFYKFPPTPYIEIDTSIKRNDKILSTDEITSILKGEIIVEEKIDGANIGISFDANGKIQVQNRGSYIYSPYLGQWKKLSDFLIKKENILFDILLDKYILFGEWCYAKHSVYYDHLPDWFIGFDIFDIKCEKFFSVDKRNFFLKEMGVEPVPQLAKGSFEINELSTFFDISKFGSELSEGIYIRKDSGDYLEYRAKMVRKEFRQKIGEHWMRGILQSNRLK